MHTVMTSKWKLIVAVALLVLLGGGVAAYKAHAARRAVLEGRTGA